MAYKPIDDQNEYNLGTSPALHSAVATRVKDNAADTQSKRLLRRGTSFHPGVSSATNTLTFVESDLTGYFDPGIPGNNPETKGFQFSTHPSKPMIMPLGWFDSALAGRFKIRICMTVENAPMEMYAFALDPRDTGYPFPVIRNYNTTTNGRGGGGGFPDAATSGFSLVITGLGSPQYIKAPVTAVSPNTDGFSFFEFDFSVGKSDDLSTATSDEFERNDTLQMTEGRTENVGNIEEVLGSVYLCLAFCSTADQTSPTAITVQNPLYSNKAINYQTSFPTLAPFGPGKIHALLEVPDGILLTDGTYADTYHHCVQVRPDDPLAINYGNTDAQILVYPQIPPSARPSQLATGGTHNLYPLSKATVYSVSVEEVLA